MPAMADAAVPPLPDRDCPLCPRLVAFRHDNRAKFPDWHNAPVPPFGELDASLLIVGLAPGLRGANRTARPFTGDYAGDLLYATLLKFGLAKGTYRQSPDDGLTLTGARITNAVRCVPPQNKPEPSEFVHCRPFLIAEIAAMKRLKAILALGKGAHDQILRALNVKPAGAYPFIHGRQHRLPSGVLLADSYHCSRYNTNTRRLTTEMFETVFEALMPALR
ncbi:MAG: uracil-DNA glycosylase [Reyranellaceae bacterium]